MAYHWNSDEKFNALQQQLDTIQQTIKQITQLPLSAPIQPVSRPVPSTKGVPPFEGQSSFHHESLLAKDAVLSAVAGSQDHTLENHVAAALSTLKNSLDRSTVSPLGQEPQSETQSPSLSKEQLLPVDLAIAVIRTVKGQYSSFPCETSS